MEQSLKIVEFRSLTPGSHLVIFGQIHGDEPNGRRAINRVINEIETGQISQTAGRLTFVPCCNPQAALDNKRFVEKNLNRVFTIHPTPVAYEEHLANCLLKIQGKPTLFLDLHSYPTEQDDAPAFAIEEFSNNLSNSVVAKLPIKYCLKNWQKLKQKHGRPKVFSTLAHTTRFHVPGIGLECGKHNSRTADNVAYEAIRRAMSELNIAPYRNYSLKTKRPLELFFKDLFIYPSHGGTFVKKWSDFTSVKRGEVIARTSSGVEIKSARDGYIILPDFHAKCGEEWFYVAA